MLSGGEEMKRKFGWGAILGLIATALVFQWSTSASDKSAAPVTFAKDVAPILYKNCAGCHRPGEVAPMSLLSYKQVRPWAKSIREVVAERRMPPWLAALGRLTRHGQSKPDCFRKQARQSLSTSCILHRPIAAMTRAHFPLDAQSTKSRGSAA